MAGAKTPKEPRAAGRPPDPRRIRRVARERFGYERLRAGQLDAVRACVAGRDTLAVMPTAWGKSAIYQIAAVLIDGPTVVVSPMLALQRDQVEALSEVRAGAAAAVNSTITAAERRDTLDAFAAGELEFVFLAPEQLDNDDVLEHLDAARPSLFVVDEAHCISEWGHDFRPDYLRLGDVVERLGHPVTVALTATASPPVRRETVERLGMRDPAIVVRGFDRPNIRLAVHRFIDANEKAEALTNRVRKARKPGIVYVATRRHAEALAASLVAAGVDAAAYHAGMSGPDRAAIQERFMEGSLGVIVATNAFGMGIDKHDVRFVFHVDVPGSLDSYYQELGRAGRDRRRAHAELFFLPDDLHVQRFFAGAGKLEDEDVEAVLDALRDAGGASTVEELRERTELSATKAAAAVARLEEVGAVERPSADEVRVLAVADDAASEAADAQERHRMFERSQIEMMRGYGETDGCRREYLLSYFGETYRPPCNRCDNCERGLAGAPPASVPFPLQSEVVHVGWGTGTVQRYEDDRVVVLFDSVGYRQLALDLVREKNLLRPAGSADLQD